MWLLIGYWFFFSTIALGQDAVPVVTTSILTNPLEVWPGFMKVLAFIAALQILLRGIAEALTRISDFTETKWDNKTAGILSEISWVIGVALGKFGYGEPRLVSKEKIDQATGAKKGD